MTLSKDAPTIEEMPASERIVVILPKELVETLTALAKAKGLARTAYIRMVLTEHVQETEIEDLGLSGRTAKELYAEWEKAREDLVQLRGRYIVIETAQPGVPIKTPERALTEEALKELTDLERKVDVIYEAYLKRMQRD